MTCHGLSKKDIPWLGRQRGETKRRRTDVEKTQAAAAKVQDRIAKANCQCQPVSCETGGRLGQRHPPGPARESKGTIGFLVEMRTLSVVCRLLHR